MMGFELYKIEDVCFVGDGAHASIARQNDGILYLTAKNFKENGLELNNVEHISIHDYEKHFCKNTATIIKPSDGDLVFSIIGSIGVPYIVKKRDVFGLSSSVAILRPVKEKILSRYLYYWILSATFQTYVDNIKSGVAQGFLSLGMIKKLPVSLPPFSIQGKIAAILSAYDDLIENNNRRIAILEKMAEELYREWFVRLRFPGHEKVNIVKGVPEGWEKIKVGNAFDIMGGGTPSTEISQYWQDGNINWYTPSDITSAKGIFLTASKTKCTQEGLAKSSARVFPSYSVMMTSRATIGAIGINTTNACTNQGFITCIPSERYPLAFLYHWLKLNKQNFEMLSSGSTFLELIKTVFKKIEVLTPPMPLITKYEAMARPLFEKMEKIIGANETLIRSRDKLLSRLMSGKLSVEDLDIKFPASMQEEVTAHA
jgi:type I restriction enzyme, S subunit